MLDFKFCEIKAVNKFVVLDQEQETSVTHMRLLAKRSEAQQCTAQN